jgi:hypothetical protein
VEKNRAPASPDLGQYQFTLCELLNNRAWQLVSGDPKSRDPRRAVDLAQEAAAVGPRLAWWNVKVLGVAHYRAGNWNAAALTLEKSQQLPPPYRNDSEILFFLSMAYGRLNEKQQARKCYDEAVGWRMGLRTREEELRRVCAEAAALLGLEIPPPLKEPPVLSPGPVLVLPAAGATLDNATPGGERVVWEFDWSDVPGATRYHLYVADAAELRTALNDPTLTSSSLRGAVRHITEQYRPGWRWKVRALVNGVWSDWSEERRFDVGSPVAN